MSFHLWSQTFGSHYTLNDSISVPRAKQKPFCASVSGTLRRYEYHCKQVHNACLKYICTTFIGSIPGMEDSQIIIDSFLTVSFLKYQMNVQQFISVIAFCCPVQFCNQTFCPNKSYFYIMIVNVLVRVLYEMGVRMDLWILKMGQTVYLLQTSGIVCMCKQRKHLILTFIC